MKRNCLKTKVDSKTNQNLMIEKSLWSPSIPCKNFNLRINKQRVPLPRNIKFYRINSSIGSFYYPKDKSPVFSSPYFKPNSSQNSSRFFTYAPARVDLELTYRCNLKCQHCYVATPKLSQLDLDIKRAQKLLKELKKTGVIGLQLLGGEPSLYPYIREFIRMAKSCDLKIEIVSNGSKTLIKNCLSVSNLIDCMYISIDGTQHTHDQLRGVNGSFKSALECVDIFSQRGVKTRVICTLNNKNKGEIKQFIEIIKKTKADGLIFKFILPVGNGKKNNNLIIPQEERQIIREKIRKISFSYIYDQMYPALNDVGQFSFFGCPGGRFSIRISPTGNVHWCIYSNEILGNIYEKSFHLIWGEIIKRNFYGKSSCPYALRCGGPCKLSLKYKPGKLYCAIL